MNSTTDILRERILEFVDVDGVAAAMASLVDAQKERIIELETELRITQAALARATAGDVTA